VPVPASCVGLLDTFDIYVAPTHYPMAVDASHILDVNRVALEHAIAVWEDVIEAQGPLFIFVDQSQPCDLLTISDSGTLPEGKVGMVEFGSCGNKLLTFHNYSSPGDFPASMYTDQKVMVILLHELGHVMGLKHETNDPSSILYPTVYPSQQFSDRSVCAARFSYERVK